MRERRTLAPIQVGNVTITPVVDARVEASTSTHGLWVWGSVRPVAILLRQQGREMRIELGPEPSALEWSLDALSA